MAGIRNLLVGILGAGLLTIPGVASASYDLSFSYHDGGVAIADGLLQLQYTPGFFGGTYPFNLSSSDTVIDDINTNQPPVIQTYFFGLYEPATQGVGQPAELVMFVNNTFAAVAAGNDFATMFPGYSEPAVTQGLADDFCCDFIPPNYTPSEAAYIFQFANAEGPSVSFVPGSDFSVITFSSGKIVGTGVSSVIPLPEPAAWALMLVGFGGLGAAMRSRRRLAGANA
jgi:hypothetical protein